MPVFTRLKYARLPAQFKAWLALDHSKKRLRSKKASSEKFSCIAPGIYYRVVGKE